MRPIGLFTAIYAHRLLEKDEGIGFGQGADSLGAILITASLMLGVYTIVEPAAKDGWGAPLTLGLGAGSLVLLALFVAREATTSNPLIPLRIFRSRNVTGANLVQVLTVAGMFGVFFMGSLYLQQVQGYDALQIGLAFLPVTIIMGTLTGRYSEPLIMRFGARRLLFPGLALVAAGLAYFTRAPVDGNYLVYVLPVLVLLGTGVGICFPALMTLAMSGATRADAGLASGLVNTSAQVGGALGLAVLATLSASRTDSLEAAGQSTASALTSGYHLAFWVAAGLVVAAIAVVALVIQPEEKAAGQFAGEESEEMPERGDLLRGRVAVGWVRGRADPAGARERPDGRHHDHRPQQRPAASNRGLALPPRRPNVSERIAGHTRLVREPRAEPGVHLSSEGQRPGGPAGRRSPDHRRGREAGGDSERPRGAGPRDGRPGGVCGAQPAGRGRVPLRGRASLPSPR